MDSYGRGVRIMLGGSCNPCCSGGWVQQCSCGDYDTAATDRVYGYAMRPVVQLSGLPSWANGTYNLDSTADLRLFSTPNGTKFTYQGVEKCCEWIYVSGSFSIALRADQLFIAFSADGYRYEYASDSIGEFMCARATSSGASYITTQGTATAVAEIYTYNGTRNNSPRSFYWTLSLL